MMSACTKISSHQCKYPQCGRLFSKANNLKQHERTHTGERPYACDICGRRFKQNGSLYNHQRVHSDAPLVKCSVESCNSVFSTLRNMRRHLKERHTDFSFAENTFDRSIKRRRESNMLESPSNKEEGDIDCLNKKYNSPVVPEKSFSVDKPLHSTLLASIHNSSTSFVQHFPFQSSLLSAHEDWFKAAQTSSAIPPLSLAADSFHHSHKMMLIDQPSKFLHLLNAINEPSLQMTSEVQQQINVAPSHVC